MSLERNTKNRNIQNLYDECKRLKSYHTIFTMKDGSVFDGIIESVDQDCVIVLVGEDVMDEEFENQYNQQRQYGRPRRFRRFRRRSFPLATLIALSLLQYPYYAPPYSYYHY
ncbi:hypothetical protein CHF27_013775 [Romboutsia maritimum]|uniref:Uncharacterized protein n=1 Tax=Romboutsia maritimum TaxID=2020948 RepID=A0A371IPI4_9FIRM|nr:hypothetical protein [Romboutsia maritimum]RDY22386.1 hypothetical protein CHF27_013775 [Romboutsia maritimum]